MTGLCSEARPPELWDPAGYTNASRLESCSCRKYEYQASTTKPPCATELAPKAPGARRGAPLKRPQQPGLHQPATCRAACWPPVRCVSHSAGLQSLCLDVHAPRPGLASPLRSLHLQAAPDVRRAATWAARRTASERPCVAPQAALERGFRRASGICEEACARAHGAFRAAAPRASLRAGGGVLGVKVILLCTARRSPRQSAALRSARRSPHWPLRRREPVDVRRRAAERGISRLLSQHYRLLLTTCLAHEVQQILSTLHAACTPDTHMHVA